MVTDYAEITKDIAALGAPPNLADYDALCASWSWDDVVAELDLPGRVVQPRARVHRSPRQRCACGPRSR